MNISLALAGDEFVPAHTPDGARCLLRSVRLAPGESMTFNAVLAPGRKQIIAAFKALESAREEEIFRKHVAEYREWFDRNAPRFSCSDPDMEKVWHYRWFLARQNRVCLDVPDFSLPVFYEGKHEPIHHRVSTFSSSCVLMEVRWLRDRVFAQGQIRALLRKQLPNGLLPSVRMGSKGAQFTHWLPAAAFEAFKVNGSLQFLKETLPLLKDNLEATLAFFDEDGDGLPASNGADHTGMNGRPCFPKEGGEREDPAFTAYVFASARALAEGFRILEKPEEARAFEEQALRVKQAALEKMWNKEDGFFYALREDHPVRCQEAAGLFPFFSRLPPNESPYRAALDKMVDPKAFWSPIPLATLSVRDAAYTPQVRAGPSGYLWNGPVFPYAQSILAEVFALALRHYTPSRITESDLLAFLTAYTRLHFEEGDAGRPILRECYDGECGEGFGEPDFFSSTYNDLIIRFVGGLVPRADGGYEVRPLVKGLETFRFQNLPYHGKRVDITWDRPNGKRVYEGIPEGYTLTADGERVFHSQELKPATVSKER
jgi:hypothetical protein